MPSYHKCCVPGCKSKSDQGVMHHAFPNPETDRERFNTWMLAIKNIELHGMENEKLRKNHRVCHLHFETRYHNWKNRITNIAVPILNLPGFLKGNYPIPARRPLHQVRDVPQPSTSKHNTLLGPSLKDDKCLAADKIEMTEQKEDISPLLKDNKCLAADNMEVTEEKENISPSLKDNKCLAADNMEVTEEKENINSDCNINRLPEQNKTERTYNVKKREKTEVEKRLYKQILAARVKIAKMKNKIKKQSDSITAAKELSTNPAFLEVLENCTNTAKLLLNIQCRETSKKKKGRRFTMDEKIVSLSIYKRSPKAYRFLRKIFVLPAPQTLVKCIQRMNLKPGINKNLFEQLKNRTKKMTIEEKICILLFDEVSLKPNITYNERKDKITGLIDNGENRKSKGLQCCDLY